MTRTLLLLALAGLGVVAPVALVANHHEAAPTIDAVLAADIRKDDRVRDMWRHPKETLAFFQVKPGMTVADYMPSGGWYTRILVPYLGEKGRYIGVSPAAAVLPPAMATRMADGTAKFVAAAAAYTGAPASRIMAVRSDAAPAELVGSVDRVLIFREMHNIKRWNATASELAAVRAMLKPDGMLGIEQHRAKANAPDAYVDGSNGYLREADVIASVEAAGFRLVEKSEINANPKDSADHEGGVWTLPPAGRDPAMVAIGESDRMTLLFAKR